MNVLTKFARRFTSLASYTEQPVLLSLKLRGGLKDTYHALNQPWFHALEINTVLDIGANTGQFTTTMFALLPHAQVYAFEPLPDCYEQLVHRIGSASRFRAMNIGLGDHSGKLSFERSDYSPSSSFLSMSASHREAFPYTASTTQLSVNVARLDDVANELTLHGPCMIKIDVQGYEMHVLRGGENTVKQAQLVVVETSFESLYEGQPLFDDISRLMTEWGFRYAGALDQLTHPADGRILQADSIFLKQ